MGSVIIFFSYIFLFSSIPKEHGKYTNQSVSNFYAVITDDISQLDTLP